MTRVLNMKTKEFEGKHDSPVMDAILDMVLAASAHDKTSPLPAPPIAPAQWSTEPPREPGWYWTSWDGVLEVVSIDGIVRAETWGGKPVLWWPIPIIEPPAEAGKAHELQKQNENPNRRTK